jgi:hypothetical protein
MKQVTDWILIAAALALIVLAWWAALDPDFDIIPLNRFVVSGGSALLAAASLLKVLLPAIRD